MSLSGHLYLRFKCILFSLVFFSFSLPGKTQTIVNVNRLSALRVNYGELFPKFNPEVTSYTLILPDNILTNELKFTPESDDCLIRINDQNIHTGNFWTSINGGVSRIKIELYSSRQLVKTYYVFIERLKSRLIEGDGLTLKNVFIGEGVSKRPKWMDKNGFVYATSGDTIYKTTNNGNDWLPVHVVADSLKGESFDRSALVVSDKNRIIYCSKGKVVVSDENQNNFSVNYTFLRGSIARFHLGYSVCDSIVLLGTYEACSDTVEVILSTDFGNSWKRIFFMQKPHPGYVFHIHDVQYDPVSKQIIIVTGDSENCQIYCSEDFGETWYKVFKNSHSARVHQTSQIICFPHGVVLGSDVSPDGLMYLPRNIENPRLNGNEVIDADNFIEMDDDRNLKRFAVREWNTKKGSRTYSLLPWYHCIFPSQNTTNDYSRLWLTYNGIEWYELYKWKMAGTGLFGFMNILGPNPYDSTNTVFSNFHGSDLFKAQIQFPQHLEQPQLSIPGNNKGDVTEPIFGWQRVDYASDYRIQISSNEYFSNIIVDDSMLTGVNYFCDKLCDHAQYYWRVKAFGVDGEGNWSVVHQFNTQIIHDTEKLVEEEPVLYQNFPNPFFTSTKILYYIPDKSQIELNIYDVTGRKITGFGSETVEAGVFERTLSGDLFKEYQNKICYVELKVIPANADKAFKKWIMVLMI